MLQRVLFLLILFIVPLIHTKVLWAQQLPPSTDAAVFSEIVNKEAREKLVAKPKKPLIEEQPEDKPDQSSSEKEFFVKQIDIKGNNILTREELESLISPYENKLIRLSDAKELSKKIEQKYRDEGYIMTYVYLPPQKIDAEKLTIQILEGKMGKLVVDGNKWFSEKNLQRYSRLKEGEPLQYETLAKSVQRMNENPDREVRAILQPGEETGSTDVHLKVKDRFPIHIGGSFDNLGTESTGRRRFGTSIRHNNFLFPDATLLSGAILGKDFSAGYAQYLIPLSRFGTKLSLGFSGSRISPKKEFKGFDIDGRSQTYTSSLTQPLIEKENFKLNSSLGFNLKDSTTINIAGTSRRDRLRILKPGLDMSFSDRFGATSLSNEISFGLDIFGATSTNNPVSSRRGAPPNFIKLNGSINRNLRLPGNTLASAEFNYQLALDQLTPQEQLYLGGMNSVRGYPEGDFLADQGFSLSLEYSFPPFFIPEDWKLPFAKRTLKNQFQFTTFTDIGFGQIKGPAKTQKRSRYLQGVGAGVRVFVWNNISTRIEYAFAIGNEPLTESNHSRVHFTLQLDI